jgi:hypothetical protein
MLAFPPLSSQTMTADQEFVAVSFQTSGSVIACDSRRRFIFICFCLLFVFQSDSFLSPRFNGSSRSSVFVKTKATENRKQIIRI